jgi:hypothetical protein
MAAFRMADRLPEAVALKSRRKGEIMKKRFLLFIAFFGLLSYASAAGSQRQQAGDPGDKGLEIVMDREGKVESVRWNGERAYPPAGPTAGAVHADPFIVGLPDGAALPKAFEAGTRVTIRITAVRKRDALQISISPKKAEYELVPIFTGKTVPVGDAARAEEIEDKTSSFILDRSGTVYEVKVIRTGQAPPPGKVIFAESLRTRPRYYLGSHVGAFVPLRRSSEYALGYAGPDAAAPVIMESRLRSVPMVFVGTVYPFGFEPGCEAVSPRRVQVNLGTELSGQIFKKVYFGLGYDFTYFSVGALFRYGETQALQSGFSVGGPVPDGVDEAPTVAKNKLDIGLTVCLPLDLMIGWLGRSLGIK